MTKMIYLDIFGLEFEKTIVIFETDVLEFVQFQSLVQNKNLEIWEQKCLICAFLDWNLKIILSYLIVAPSNLYNCKVSQKNKDV